MWPKLDLSGIKLSMQIRNHRTCENLGVGLSMEGKNRILQGGSHNEIL